MSLEAGAAWEQDKPALDDKTKRVLLRGPIGADSSERIERFVRRERSRSRVLDAATDLSMLGFERRFGPTLDYQVTPPDAAAQRVGISVARLVELPMAGPPIGFATGFMVSPRLLLTNWHVFEDASQAEGVAAQFGYEYLGSTLQFGSMFQLEPARFFVSDKALDFALVAVAPLANDGATLEASGFIRPIAATGKILAGHSVHLIAHPAGQPKTYVVKNNPLVSIEPQVLRYLTDSDEGASGAPAFNPMWELVALHHRAVPKMVAGKVMRKDGGVWTQGMNPNDIDWLANEGIRVSSLVTRWGELARTAGTAGYLDELLSGTADPLGGNPSPVSVPTSTSPFLLTGAPQMNNDQTPVFPLPPNFTFTGPVTINVISSATAPAAAPTTALGTAGPGLEVGIRFDPRYDKRKGYQDNFLAGLVIPMPSTRATRLSEMLLDGAGKELVLPYRHFSLAMNKERRLQMWSAVNVSYVEAQRQWFGDRDAFGDDRWLPDPRIPAEYQLMDPDAYAPSRSLQRGHIVRRDDSAWGMSSIDQEYSNSDTFHWTNCTPQHGGFNQSSYPIPGSQKKKSYPGIWGGLENKIAALIKKTPSQKAIIFGGPVLDPADQAYDWGMGPVQIPMSYWKVVIASDAQGAKAYGFVLDQTQAFDDLGFERLNFGKYEIYQRPLTEISDLCEVEFPPNILSIDVRADGKSIELGESDEIPG